MIRLQHFFNEIPVFFILALTGYVLVKIRILNDSAVKGISGTLMYAAMPALIFSSFVKDISPDIFIDFAEAFVITAAVYLFFIAFAALIYMNKKTGQAAIGKLSIVFSNCAFMGIPVIQSLFGSEGIIYTSIFILFYNIFLWTYAIKLYDSRLDVKKNYFSAILNPGIIAMAAGFLIGFFEIPMPYFILKTTDLLGSLTTPAAMLIVGAMFAQKSMLASFKSLVILKISLIRLILIPVVLTAVFWALNITGLHVNVIIILSAMPVATTVAIMAEQYNKEPSLAAGAVGYSTILSVITVPVIYYFLDKLFLNMP